MDQTVYMLKENASIFFFDFFLGRTSFSFLFDLCYCFCCCVGGGGGFDRPDITVPVDWA